MVKYDHEKLSKVLLEEYQKKYGSGNPSTSINRLLECMDDAFVDEWRKQVLDEDRRLQAEAERVQREAEKSISNLADAVEASKENGVKDERVADALTAYKTIISLEFDTPQQTLQNIQNASYFIWALYAQGGSVSNMFFNSEKVASVKDESSRPNAYKDIPVY